MTSHIHRMPYRVILWTRKEVKNMPHVCEKFKKALECRTGLILSMYMCHLVVIYRFIPHYIIVYHCSFTWDCFQTTIKLLCKTHGSINMRKHMDPTVVVKQAFKIQLQPVSLLPLKYSFLSSSSTCFYCKYS